ncbi:MAG: hypothetical protein SPF36_01425 [Lachnospiraceae bacterium]|nr:hypothetical protein [Lachnospiraceae bacterium]
MGVMESYEYYSACPQCGAANIGHEKCDYCGASLIKKRVNTKLSNYDAFESEDDRNLREDIDYPVINAKLFGNDSFLVIFCSLFGSGFLLIPTVLCISFVSTGIMEMWAYAMFLIFWLIGIGALIPLINHIIKKSKCNKGTEIEGIVRGYEKSMVMVNGSPTLRMRILIDKETEPKILVLNTGSTRRVYPIGKTIKLKGYNNNFIIVENKII